MRWLPQLGNVNLTVELKDRTLTVDATPLQAAVIELFDKQGTSLIILLFSSPQADPFAARSPFADTWSPDLLQSELRVTDLGTVRNALYFWNNLGVLANLPGDDLWRLVEEVGKEEGAGKGAVHGESDD